MPTKVEKDHISGTETTGHEWDGISELNTPLPKWWLYVFYACVIWSVAYFVFYPAIPFSDGATKGLLGYNSRVEVEQIVAEAKQAKSKWMDQIAAKDLEAITGDEELMQFIQAGGRTMFGDNCAPCHGAGGQGRPGGYPTLADDDWIWGGDLDNIYYTVAHGIRNVTDEDARLNDMPRYGADELLEPAQINDVAEYVLSLSNKATDNDAAARGAETYAEECSACHGEDGKGLQDLGGPNLADAIWLYGGEKEEIVAQISAPKQGVMPAWGQRLSEADVKMLTIYVHSYLSGQ